MCRWNRGLQTVDETKDSTTTCNTVNDTLRYKTVDETRDSYLHRMWRDIDMALSVRPSVRHTLSVWCHILIPVCHILMKISRNVCMNMGMIHAK